MKEGLFHCERFNCRLAPKACVKRRKLKDPLGRPAFPECVSCKKARKTAPAKTAKGSLPPLDVLQTAAASLELATFHVLFALSQLGTVLGGDEEQSSKASRLLEHLLGIPLDDDVARVASKLATADKLLLAAASTNMRGLFRVDAKALQQYLPMKDLDRELLRRLRLEKNRRLKLLQLLLQRGQSS